MGQSKKTKVVRTSHLKVERCLYFREVPLHMYIVQSYTVFCCLQINWSRKWRIWRKMPKSIEVSFWGWRDNYGWMTKLFVVLMCSGIAQRSRSFLISIKAITEAHRGTLNYMYTDVHIHGVHVYTIVNSDCMHTHTHTHTHTHSPLSLCLSLCLSLPPFLPPSYLSDFGQVFCNVGVYEMQQSASVAFTNFGLAHKCVTYTTCIIHCNTMYPCNVIYMYM